MCDGIILACLVALLVLGTFSFFFAPLYEKGVWIVLAAVSHLLAAAAGAKFGLALPRIQIETETDAAKTTDRPTDSHPGDKFGNRVGFAPGQHGPDEKGD